MLDLEASIHFHEIVLLSLSVKNKLDCTCVVVPNCLSSSDSSFTNLPSQVSVNQWWCFLNNFLMASLHSTVTFIQVHIVPMFITKNLNFNVSRFFDVLLKDHMVIVKSFHCFVLRWLELLHEFLFILDDTHAFATTTEGSFKHDWEADFFSFLEE